MKVSSPAKHTEKEKKRGAADESAGKKQKKE